jgi:hypothetical protein
MLQLVTVLERTNLGLFGRPESWAREDVVGGLVYVRLKNGEESSACATKERQGSSAPVWTGTLAGALQPFC